MYRVQFRGPNNSFPTKLIGILVLWLFGSLAHAQGLVAAKGVTDELASALAQSTTHLVNEVSNRRRLTTFFGNEQSPFYGVQVNYVNVRRGNLTFLNRDLVRLDRIPIVFGRVYDSQLTGPSDFGPGWKLAVSEIISRDGGRLVYRDAAGSLYELAVVGDQISSTYAHLTGIAGGRIGNQRIDLRVGDLTKRFQEIGDSYYLVSVTNSLGETLRFQYEGTSIVRIDSQTGRFIEIQRDANGRIIAASDDSGRAVRYEYDAAGNLSRFVSIGGSVWELGYDEEQRLVEVVDPRGNAAVRATHDEDGRASSVSVLFDSMSFVYDLESTRVDNALQTSATFWHHDSGLTRAARDFEGSYTEVSFDTTLRPTGLSFNGAAVASIDYGPTGQPIRMQVRRRGGDEESRFEYDGSGRLRRVITDGDVTAAYEYGSNGEISRADDSQGDREYRYTADGRLTRVRVDDVALNLNVNDQGLLLSFNDSGSQVRIDYDDRDQVRQIRYRSNETEDFSMVQTSFEYDSLGLRSDGTYQIEGERKADIFYGYDSLGNLTDIGLVGSEGNTAAHRYVLGANNEVREAVYVGQATLTYDYDPAGRPVRSLVDGHEAEWEYDRLGRLSSYSVNGDQYLTSDYGPMDVDAATEADGRTPLTTVSSAVASSIFGSLDSVAYARVRGSAYGLIQFNPTMGRFIVRQSPMPSPDAVLMASLKRRFIPIQPRIEGIPAVNPFPNGFDKPSNGLFLPPEFSALNCYTCTFWGAGGTFWLEVDGTTSGTAQAAVGQPVYFEPGGDIETMYCTGMLCIPELGCQPYYNPFMVSSEFTFGDGTGIHIIDGGPIYKTYSSPGSYNSNVIIWCWACDPYNPIIQGVMGQAQREVSVCNLTEFETQLFDNFLPRPSNRKTWHAFSLTNGVFSFSVDFFSTSSSANFFLDAFDDWESVLHTDCNGVTSRISGNVSHTTSPLAKLVVDTVSELTMGGEPVCGTMTATTAPIPRDEIVVVQLLGGGNPYSSCLQYADSAATHEFGHFLGFEQKVQTIHAVLDPTDIMFATVGPNKTIKPRHARILVKEYAEDGL